MLKVNVFTIGIGHFGLKHQYLIKHISKIFLLVFVLKFTEGETYTAGWAKFHLVINQKFPIILGIQMVSSHNFTICQKL